MTKTFLLYLFLLSCIAGISQPANDQCSGASTAPTNGSCTPGTTVGAADNWQGSVGCQGGGSHPDVWYSFVAVGTQAQFTITTSAPWSGNVELVLVQGSCAGGFTLAGSQCGASPLNTTMNGLTVGATYYFTISNVNNGTPGPFQVCLTNISPPTLAGQDCSNAAILCTSTTFSQPTSNSGFGAQEVSAANSCFNGGERQSKWFKFTAGCNGTLEFNINPVNGNDDYDWALWNITSDPTGCASKGNSIACNWSGCTGATGISTCATSEPGAKSCGSATGGDPCGNGNFPRAFGNWSSPFIPTNCQSNTINLVAGNAYALLIDNFSISNSGFTLTFGGACGGGTAKIGPTADFTYTTPSCGTFNFTKTCQTTNSTFLWTFGDGNTSTQQNPSHTYGSGGTYTVVLEVTDALGCKKTSSQTVTTQIPTMSHSPATTVLSPLTVCSGSTVSFTLSSTTPNTTFSWISGDVGATGTTSGSGTGMTDVVTYLFPPGMTGYNVTPTSNGCSGPTQIIYIRVLPNGTPNFNPIGPFCQNAVPPALPSTSTNGYAGTWNPSSISTATVGTTNYTFTPNAGVCATTRTIPITITNPTAPTFNPVPPICAGDPAPSLPTTSTNGITGTWSPATVSNTATTTYTFTPNAGQCATTATLTVTVNANVTPTFNAIAPICSGSVAPTLPTTSTNGIIGTWSPATVSNTATTTYTFTPNAGQCATTATLTVTVNANVTPTFNAIAPICSGSVAPTLPGTSTNGITGTWSPATVSNTTTTTYTFTPNAGQCATTATLTVTVNANVTPTFNAIAPICSGSVAPTLPTTSTNGITGTWSPATVSNTATTTYTFTPNAGQCATTATLTVTVNSNVTPTFNAIAPICSGSVAPTLPGTSTNGITGTWSPATVSNTATTTYTFTPNAGQCATTATLTVTVNANVTPTFNAIAPICNGSVAPSLPTTSNNGIPGTWSPATVSNTATTTYTFTPNAGQCATTATLTVTVNSNVTPTFNAIAPICSGSVAPSLPTTSINGITGTWSPATVSNTTTTTYTFTPNAGQCATTATLTVTVNPNVTPTFNAIAPICSGSVAPTLPTTSTNGITGTWSPATVSNTATTTYTFTPNAGQCATTATLTVTVNSNVTPNFNAIAPICSGSVAPSLPTTSTNGITGTWSPATVSNTATTTYTFTPNAGQCATTATLTVTVNANVTPTFNAIAPICSGSVAPTLPGTSTNGITGTWSPATVSNTATTTYTFTPNAGQCATTATLTVTVNSNVTPTFNAIAPICSGSVAPSLPPTSTNGITGTWSPATVSNTTTTTYTFTPNAGQCATTATLTVTVNPNVTPNFNAIAPICSGSVAPTLPTTSTNGITGTWSPATVSNTATTTYTFTPNAGQCATTATLSIVVNPVVTPTFNPIGSLCQNAVAPALATSSLNGITGTWNPATISTSTVGTTTYTFTPAAGQCAVGTSLDVTVATQINPVFTQIGPLCLNAVAPALPGISNNGITGSWNPATISTITTGTTTYTFTPNAGQCATSSTTMDIVVTATVTPTFNAIAPICSGSVAPSLPTTSTNGITGTWSPATVSNTATTTYTFTPNAGQCATTATLTVTVNANVTPTFNAIAPICSGSVAPSLPTTSTNGITGTWSPATVSNTTTTTYTFTPNAGQCATTATLTVTVNANVTPTFNAIAPICNGSVAPSLPNTSTNGITGTWSPATVSNTTTTTYTFTSNAGQCATTATLTVTVNPNITPTFNAIAPICSGSVAPTLPGTSTNGITGTWSPATVSNTATTTYTFTPNAGQCATTATLSIVVNPVVTPTFNPIGSLCQNAVAPALATSSLNGITGTWNPATISTSTVGTTTYTFTPAAGQCAVGTSLDVTVATQINPVFTQIGPLCLNAVAPALPGISNNGITGSWNPATISTITTGTTTYTFTPNAGQCATSSTTMDIVVTATVTPTFNAIAPICSGSVAPTLPTTSTNAITGTWSPATVSNTATTTYTFTPNAGQCATTTILSIVVNPVVTPTFNPIGSLCQNAAAPALATSSLNGITGTWNPATISTSTVGTTTYTFTPAAGQCAVGTSLDVTVATQINPVFTQIGPLCLNAVAPALPGISNNGITGNWSPSVINTSSTGTTTYTFTPNANQCATATATMDITITNSITPTFNPIGSLCQNSAAPSLAATSLNGITGTWSPASISTATVGTTTYTFTPSAGQCASTTTLSVTIATQISPLFTAIGPLCLNATAPTLPATSNNGITGNWNPSVINTSSTGTTTYTFTPNANQCATASATMDITITNSITPTFNPIGSLCQNSAAPSLATTSLNGITGTWNPASISTATVGTTTYTFTPSAGQCASTTTLSVTIATQISPVFTAIGPLCLNATAPTLPTNSNNGITGTWSPSVINTSSTGTTTYTFTPNANQCATASATMDITITNSITPTFNPIGSLCQNSAAPSLVTTSLNGITGTWSPASISTATVGTTTYTFTPSAGQCASTTTLIVTIATQISPVFTAIGPLCLNATAPTLPGTSNNGITGSWNPATISTATTGTTTYTFTPNAGQCATASATMDITITNSITPTFNPIGSLCQNSAAPSLVTTSLNGITGTWSPASISTATVGTTTYTFTPSAGQCASTTTLSVTIATQINPVFTQIGPLCLNAVAPTLPGTSNNGITGNWNPSVINTSSTGTTTYTFTPNANQCATASATMDITITNSITPTFNPIGSLCQNSAAPSLVTTSLNGIIGTWSPASISTATVGTTTYTFTPSAGQCASTTTLSVTIATQISPVFTTIGPLCLNAAAPTLPATSNNGITGNWSPSVINTSSTGTTTYTFTPNANQCATAAATMDITITNSITPTFNPIGSLCQNSAAPSLATTSLNGITGTWSPASISTATVGTTTYTFTPSAGQCASTTTLIVTIATQISPVFTAIGPLCLNATAPTLPGTSNNGITGSWNPATISTATTGTTTYTFTPNAGQCATSSTTMDIIVTNTVTPNFNAIAPICSGSVAPGLPTTSTNGITGTWSPATVSNTATTTYTFTPNAGQCATSTSLSVVVNPAVTPTFNAIAPICSGDVAPTLPTTSTNGITGTWSPSTVSNTATTTYTFTPNAAQCTSSTTLTIIVDQKKIPSFTAISPICVGSNAPTLPGTSLNGIRGSWSPSSISNTISGRYTFNPLPGQCATSTFMDIAVVEKTTPVFDIPTSICKGETAPLLPGTSLNGYAGLWSPSTINNQASASYVFTPLSGECASPAGIQITVLPLPFADAGEDANAEYNYPLTLRGSGGVSYSWSPAALLNNASLQNPVATLLQDTTFILTVTDSNGCRNTDSVYVRVLNGPEIYVPSAFTPNHDGLNDIFRPIPVGITSIEFFRVFNRYGEMLFETNQLNKGWDGTYKGIPQNANIYVWQVKGTDRNGVVKILKGTVMLIR